MQMGIVGLPNVGKSSLFNLLTEQAIAAENYPFCTIDPNEGRCPVGYAYAMGDVGESEARRGKYMHHWLQ